MMTFVRGQNFSGRSEVLQRAANFGRFAASNSPYEVCAYFDLNVSNFCSGVASTVADEIDVNTKGRDAKIAAEVVLLSEQVQLNALLGRSPYALSGGEQTVLAVLIAALVEPKIIAIDNALEQLSPAWRALVLRFLQQLSPSVENVIISDNRLDDEVFERNFFDSICKQPDPQVLYQIGDLPRSIELVPHTIHLERVSFRYPGEDWVLNELSCEFRPGTIYHLRGANGAGKSTLSKLLAGLLRPQIGTIRANGQIVSLARNPGRLFAYHFQNPDFQLFRQSLVKEVASSSGERSSANAWLASFGLATLAKVHPFDISPSLRKRLALAATFAMQRPWIILDEPTLGQDDQAAASIARLCESYGRSGGGVIIVSHSTKLSRRIDAKSLVLRGGKLWEN